jgi:hypothetical protein
MATSTLPRSKRSEEDEEGSEYRGNAGVVGQHETADPVLRLDVGRLLAERDLFLA